MNKNENKIIEISAIEILDSRGNPTLEVEVKFEDKKGDIRKAWESVPSGASTGEYEAYELRDGDKSRYGGKGVLKAIENIEKIIAPKLIGKNVENQEKIDQIMIDLDGTKNKKNLGANAILGVSMAVCRAGAIAKEIPLYEYIKELSKRNIEIPRGYFNIINGGMHAGNKIAFQEFMISPNLGNFSDNYRASSEIYHKLKSILKEKFGGSATLLGDEGGFAPNDFVKAEEVLDILMQAIKDSGYENKIDMALDIAASEFFSVDENGNKRYDLGLKMKNRDYKTGDQMLEIYMKLMEKYPIVSIEDPFDQSDFEYFAKLTKIAKDFNVQIVGDDLTVTNVERIKRAIDEKSCNALLLKLNQIGTITESINALKLAKSDNWEIMVSHRSGETISDFIADFVVGTGVGQIKSGATARGERVCKYNRILAIEKEIKK